MDFSDSQLLAMSWWCGESPHRKCEAVICDGAVRSGKTLSMGLGFFLWAQTVFDGQMFALCGKTIKSLRRNVLSTVLPLLRQQGFVCTDTVSRGLVTVEALGHRNEYYIFGGMDSGSAALIQGATFAGALFDETAIMPRSFVEQACARCSVRGAKLWFNCNPEGPGHWFYREWICQRAKRRALYIHFRLEDNPGLSKKTIERYKRMFTGAFHRRFILGQWASPEGLVYDFFTTDMLRDPPKATAGRWVISCDYGTSNPASFGLWGLYGERWYRVKEFYFDSRKAGRQMTDREYVSALGRLAGGRRIDCVVVDPSAASFILELVRAGYRVIRAKNQVLSGIRQTAHALKTRQIVICRGCGDTVRELGLYCWQDSREDRPVKEHDHAMDDMRYFVSTIVCARPEDFGGMAVERKIEFGGQE